MHESLNGYIQLLHECQQHLQKFKTYLHLSNLLWWSHYYACVTTPHAVKNLYPHTEWFGLQIDVLQLQILSNHEKGPGSACL